MGRSIYSPNLSPVLIFQYVSLSNFVKTPVLAGCSTLNKTRLLENHLPFDAKHILFGIFSLANK